MALVVFLRGINVGGARRFRPSLLAKELCAYGVINIGAAGTFVVRHPRSRSEFRTELLRKLPFAMNVMICEGREVVRLVAESPFGPAIREDIVRFVSIFEKPVVRLASLPIAIPSRRQWFVRIIGAKGQFVFGTYRRHMKTIGYLGQLDSLFGATATTRNWNTILALVKKLEAAGTESAT
jgi:uncharacterized protein (DUF1697 family)